jgi:uncharacterized protein (DUF2062 family)
MMWLRIKNFFYGVYIQLAKVNDTPQRVALGVGVGVCLGIFPGTGPIAALTLAWVFRLNKAATLIGSLLTNTWLSLVTFVFAIQIGCMIFGLDWVKTEEQAHLLMSHFSWDQMREISLVGVIKPLLVGYAIVGFLCGFFAYGLTYFLLKRQKEGVP